MALVQGAEEAGIPAGFGLAVISGLADDVRVSSTSSGVSVRMSWPSAVVRGLKASAGNASTEQRSTGPALPGRARGGPAGTTQRHRARRPLTGPALFLPRSDQLH